MGSFYTNIALRSVTQEDAIKALRTLRRKAFVSPAGKQITVIYDCECEEQDTKSLCDLS